MARVKISSPVRSGSFSQIIAAREPSSVRVEALGPLGNTFFIMAADGKNLGAYSSETHEFYTGASNQENISRLLPFSISLETFVSIALGKPPLYTPDENSLAVSEDTKGYILTFDTRDFPGRQIILFSRESLMPVSATTYNGEGSPVFSMTMSDYKNIDGILFPIRITLSSLPTQVHASIRYTDIAVNSQVPDDLFTLHLPPGAKSVSLDEQWPPPSSLP